MQLQMYLESHQNNQEFNLKKNFTWYTLSFELGKASIGA